MRKLKSIRILILGGFITFYLTPVIAQGKYNKDITLFKELLEKHHPSLYDYTPKIKFDSIVNKTIENSTNIINNYDLTIALANIIEKIGCGHTTISPSPKFINEIAEKKHFFPIPVKIINHKIYALDNNYNIKVGKEILEINSINSTEILKLLYNSLSSDGRNITGKNASLDENFALYFNITYPNFKSFKLKIEGIDNDIEIKGVNLETISKKSSEVIVKYKQKNSRESINFNLLNKNIGLLTVNTFYFPEEGEQFSSYLKDLFIGINQEKISNLIIDVRNNNGGLRELAIYLYSFLTNKPFEQRILTSISDINSEYLSADTSEIKEINQWFYEKFGNNNKTTKDHLHHLMKPSDIQYKGKVYIITGNNTFSAGGEFALNCKNNPDIILVGQETSAAFKQHNGDYSFNFILPTSKMQLTIPSTHIKHYTVGDNKEKTGIYPDYFISENINDYIKQNDRSINKIVQLISEKK